MEDALTVGDPNFVFREWQDGRPHFSERPTLGRGKGLDEPLHGVECRAAAQKSGSTPTVSVSDPSDRSPRSCVLRAIRLYFFSSFSLDTPLIRPLPNEG